MGNRWNSDWKHCKNILCIRLDNLGDLLMSAPAITALKQSFGSRITLLTSSMAEPVTSMLPAIDDVIVFDAPWVKVDTAGLFEKTGEVISALRSRQFDGAVIFTTFSQSPMPSILLSYLSGIPLRLAYCRENPYQLLTHWLPEREPYSLIQHQVRRDLNMVAAIGAIAEDERIRIYLPDIELNVRAKLRHFGLDFTSPWLVIHPGASEEKRLYDIDRWIELARIIRREYNYQIVITGVKSERAIADQISQHLDNHVLDLTGHLTLEEYMVTIKIAPLLISVNTSAIHIAAAVETKVIVLYALTNPQHLPWMALGKVLPFSLSPSQLSMNEVLRFMNEAYITSHRPMPAPDDVAETVLEVLAGSTPLRMPELVGIRPEKAVALSNL
jgi:ADP-heptose:LPS heptosyltransferase